MFPPMRDRDPLHAPLPLGPLPYMGEWQGKIAYLDRDGVIIRGFENYVNNPSEVHVLKDAAKSIGDLRRNGFRICIVTNAFQCRIGHSISAIFDEISFDQPFVHKRWKDRSCNNNEDQKKSNEGREKTSSCDLMSVFFPHPFHPRIENSAPLN